MSYNIAETATLSTGGNGYLIANDAYVATPDFRALTMNGATPYTNMVVSSGGTAILGDNAYFTDATVEAGGSVTAGRWVKFTGLDLKAGATMNGAQFAQFYGTNISIASGTWAGYTGVHAANGIFYNLNANAALEFHEGAGMSGGTVGNAYVYLIDGGVASDVTLTTAGRGFATQGAYIYILDATVGTLFVYSAYADMSMGGKDTEIAAGHVEYGRVGQHDVVDSSLYVTGGVIHNLTLQNSGWWMRYLTIYDGISAAAPTIRTVGSLAVGSGAFASDVALDGGTIHVMDGGTIGGALYGTGVANLRAGGTAADLKVSGGTLNITNGAVVTGGLLIGSTGKATYADNGYVSSVTVESGGSLAAARWDKFSDVTAQSGASVNIGQFTQFYGSNINIAQGTLAGYTDVYASDGIFYNLNANAALEFHEGAGMSGGTVGNAYVYLIDGGVASDVTLTTAGRGFATQGAYIYNLDATVGTLFVYSAYADMSMGGKDTEIAAGHVEYGRVGQHDAVDSDLYVTGGVIHNLNLKNSGWWMQKLTLLDGIVAEAPNVSNGGSLTVGSGGSAESVNVLTGGKVFVSDDGLLNGVKLAGGMVTVSGGAFTGEVSGDAGQVDVIDNGSSYDVTIQQGTFRVYSGGELRGLSQNGGLLRLYAGGYVSGGDIGDGSVYLFDGADMTGVDDRDRIIAEDFRVSSGMLFLRGTNVSGSDITIYGGIAYVQNGAIADGVNVSGGAVSAYLQTNPGCVDNNVSGATVKNAVLTAGEIFIGGGGAAENVTVEGGRFNIDDYSPSIISGVTVTGGTMSLGMGHVTDLDVVAGGELTLGNDFTFEGDINFVEGTLTNDADAKASGGVIEDLDLAVNGNFGSGITLSNFTQRAGAVSITSGATARNVLIESGNFNVAFGAEIFDASVTAGSLTVFESAVVSGFEQAGGRVIVYGTDATISGATVYGGNMSIGNGGALNDATISGGAVVVRHVAGWAYGDNLTATASDVRIEAGAELTLESGGILTAGKLADGANLTVYKGGQAGLSSAAAGAVIDLSFWDANAGTPGNEDALISDWGDFSADAEVNVHFLETGYSYKIADAANANVTLDCGSYRIFDESVKSGEQHSNAFLGRNLDFSDGKTLITSSFSVDVAATAAALGTGTATALADGGFAAIWTADTDTSNVSVVADTETTGDAWVTVNGATLAAPLYGAEGNFAHDVNMWIYEGSVKNLAAGAKAGGSVENVNLLISDNGEGTDKLTFKGTAYLGGFGSVAGKVNAAVYGGSYDKDFYAGALANKNTAATSVGGVSLTVTDGKFSGNLYGASAVKTAATVGGSVRHTAGDVTLTIAGGEATQSDFCCFAGGYATGDATGTVYTVGNIEVTISDGSWGTAHGGRGIFGGVFASQVGAEAGDVDLTVSGGSMGNVYGGGWAQKNGTSIVGDVTISISGGTIANVFGGGSHSTSGGTTSADNVSIVVSGGDIAGAIYAKGHLDRDVVTGDATVTFTGDSDFSCGVYGYSYVGALEASDATLTFAGYTGDFSGAIGGFTSIEFNDGTAMTLSTAAADVTNSAWKFDVSARDAALADTAMLDWNAADFTGDTIALNLATGQSAQWTLIDAAATTAYNEFDVLVDGILQGVVTLDEQIADGDYQGWGFTLEDTVLKFKNLANA